jgi:hypothetical protein
MTPAVPKSKKRNPFDPSQPVKATRTFAWSGGVVHAGDLHRGGDLIVERNWTAFVDAGTLDSELPNMWNELPPPPDHLDSAIQIGTSPLAHVAPERLVRARSSFYFDAGHAPGSPGAESGKPSGFGTAIAIGQLVEISAPVVRAHPEHFEFPTRQCTLADIERLTREEVQ